MMARRIFIVLPTAAYNAARRVATPPRHVDSATMAAGALPSIYHGVSARSLRTARDDDGDY